MSTATGLPVCLTCGRRVQDYTMVMPFAFINGSRHILVEEAHLSCGCVIVGPSFDVDPSDLSDDTAIVTIRDLAGNQVLSFYDQFEEAA